MLKPRALRPGDRVAIVAPSSPFDREAFDRGVEELKTIRFEPVFDESVFARDGYLSGDARRRARAFTAALEAPDVSGIIAARGGYGSIQMLPFLDAALVRAARKPVVGYSDVTSILAFVSCRAGTVCFHGPHVAGGLSLGEEGYDRRSFVGVLCGGQPLGELTAPGLEAIRRGQAAGPLYGGNLTVLASSLATPFAFDPPPGHVLFLDEVGERPYRIDRLLTQFRLAGLLARAAAVVFGELPGCDEPGGTPAARAVVADLMRDFPGPVLVGFPSGHTRGPAITLPLGVEVRVEAEPARLIIEETAVA